MVHLLPGSRELPGKGGGAATKTGTEFVVGGQREGAELETGSGATIAIGTVGEAATAVEAARAGSTDGEATGRETIVGGFGASGFLLRRGGATGSMTAVSG